jgi:hypothetical protein
LHCHGKSFISGSLYKRLYLLATLLYLLAIQL